jgi:energy-coupling factor transport system permease protein
MQLATPLSVRADAPLASLNPLARVGAAVILMGFLFVALDGVTAGVVLAGILVATPMTGIRLAALVRRAWPILVAAVLIALVNGVFSAPRGPLVLALGPLLLHAGSLLAGAALGVRILAIALAGVVALATTDPTDLADALVQELHAPPRFALGALAAFRLMPLLAQEWQLVALARRARGVSAGSPIGWLRLQAGRLMTLLVSAIRRSTRLALAMEARGLGSRTCRTAARPQRMSRRDAMVLAGALLLGSAATGLSLLLGTYRPLLG